MRYWGYRASGSRLRLLVWLRAAVWLAIAALAVVALWTTRAGSRWPSLYYMTGPSMEPNVRAGEYFIAWSPAGRIAPGDLVIFRFEDADGVFHVLRRVAALPGDTVAMDSGVVILNGKRQPWPYRIVRPDVWRSELAVEGRLFDFGPWVVPPNSVVLLSDTRDMLGWPDSRFLGFIPLEDILARAELSLSGRRLSTSR
jgi:signal peptidase I